METHFAGRCPNLAQLERFIIEQSPNATLEEHLKTCPNCRRAVERVRENVAFMESMKAAVSDLGSRPESVAGESTADGGIPGYTITSRIHQGGQGVVYRALQIATKRKVALKVLACPTSLPDRQRRRFEREIEVVASLHHPNIVTIYDSGTTEDGRLFFAMELIFGSTLNVYLAERKLPERDIVRLIAKVTRAVQYAQQRGVIHRDIKPGNVLIDHSGEPHVVDFGVAKVAGCRLDGELSASVTGEFVGTLNYAAPEQVSGDPDLIDIRADVYSLGVVLYEALTGALPYDLKGPISDMVRAIVKTEPSPPSHLNSIIDNELETIILTGLQKDPARRYQSAGALAEDLERYLAGLAISAKRDSTWYILKKTVTRHRRQFLQVAALCILVVGGLIALAYGLWASRQAQFREEYVRVKARSEAAKSTAVAQILNQVIPASDNFWQFDASGRMLLDTWLESGSFNGQPEAEASVRTVLGKLFQERGKYPLAEVQFRNALRIRLTSDAGSAETAQSMNDLSLLLLERNALREAELHCGRALDIRRSLQGEDHVDVAESLDTLARILIRKPDLEEARTLAAEALDIRRRSYDDDHLEIARSLETLSLVHLAEGALLEAEKACTDALAMRFRLESDRHPDIAANLMVLAEIADKVATESSETQRAATSSLLGDSAQLRSIATSLDGTSPGFDSIALWEGLLEIKRAVLGPEHGDTAETLVALGRELLSRESVGEALARFEGALSLYVRDFGEHDLLVADCLSHLGEALAIQGRWEDVLSAKRKRYEIYREQLTGKDDMAVAVVRQELADLYAHLGDIESAEEHYLGAIAGLESAFGPETRQVALIAYLYARLLRSQDRFEEAESWSRRSVALRTRLDSVPDAWLMYYREGLAESLIPQGKFEESEKILLDNLGFAGTLTDELERGRWSHRTTELLNTLYEASGHP